MGGLSLFLGLRQHVFVQREIGHEALQRSVFLFEVSEPAEFPHEGVCFFFQHRRWLRQSQVTGGGRRRHPLGGGMMI